MQDCREAFERGVAQLLDLQPQASKESVHVQDVLQAKFNTLELFPECRALKGFSGAIDFAILSERVLIQVDGPGHYGTLGLNKAKSTDQEAVDARCNTCALRQGWHMLRIHVDDLYECESLIGDVLCVARAGLTLTEADCSWQFSSMTWSPSCGRSRKVLIRSSVGHVLRTV